MSEPFRPEQHLTHVSGRQYLEVKWRLVWLRDAHPDAQIETEMVQHQNSNAVFRAKVTLPSGASATGWGQENSQGFGDYLEKAETKALGRALAALGFGTQFTGDDLSEGERVVDSPVSAPRVSDTTRQPVGRAEVRRPASAPRGPWQPSDRQVAYVGRLMAEANLQDDQRDDVTILVLGKPFGNVSGNNELNQLIEYLQGAKDAEWTYDGAGNLERAPF